MQFPAVRGHAVIDEVRRPVQSPVQDLSGTALSEGDDFTTALHAPYHMVGNITHTSPVSNNICFHTSNTSCQTHVCKYVFSL